MEAERPRVGIGVLVFRDGKILLGKRKGSHAAGLYGGPGGHLEHMESFAECARREAKEEVGIEIENIQFLCLTNFQDHAPKHYVDIGLTAQWKSGEPTILEPDKCDGWAWYDIDNISVPLFGVVKNYIEAYKNGGNYFDS